MKNVSYPFILSLFLFLCNGISNHLQAQKVFSEGIIRYDVFVNNSEKPEGVFVVTVKNGMCKRELSMHSGYNNIIIYNQKTGMSVSYNIDEESKYALQMTAAELAEKNRRFEGAKMIPLDTRKKLAGYSSLGSNIQYSNGEAADFYYTRDLLPPNETFNAMFPGLQGIPLEYEMKSNPGMNIRFVASAIEIKSIDPTIFDVPADYKIVSKTELERLK